MKWFYDLKKELRIIITILSYCPLLVLGSVLTSNREKSSALISIIALVFLILPIFFTVFSVKASKRDKKAKNSESNEVKENRSDKNNKTQNNTKHHRPFRVKPLFIGII